jgi:hypothetical protein
MGNFLCARGTVISSKSGGAGESMYKVEGLNDGKNNILVEGISISDTDTIFPVSALSGTRFVYAFGRAFGTLSIGGVILLGSSSQAGAGAKAVEDWVDKNRVSAGGSPVKITVAKAGSSAYKVYVTGLKLSDADPQYHIQPFLIDCLIVPKPEGK